MRKLLYAAVSAVLLPTLAFAGEPKTASKPKTEAPASSSANAKAAAKKSAEEPAIPDGWTLVTSAEGKFRAAFPSKPTMESGSQDTAAGKAQMLTYAITSEADNTYLAVSVTKYPDGVMRQALPSTVLEGARDGAMANVNGKIVTDKTIMVDGPKGGSQRLYPGREYEATGPQGMRISARIILVEDRLYQVIYVRMNEKNEPFKQMVSTFALQM